MEYNLVAPKAQGSCQPWIGTQDDNLNWELSRQSMFILMLNQRFMGREGAGLNHLAARASKFVDVCVMHGQVRTSFGVRIYSRRLNLRWMTFTEEI